MRKIDLSGETYGDWRVIKESDARKNKKVYWECECLLCGKHGICSSNNLRTGKTKHCGCQLSQIRSANRTNDLTGMSFGKLRVIRREKPAETYGRTMWLCQCECGNKTIVSGIHLTQAATQSCGCEVSRGESKIAKILRENNIDFIKHYYVNIDGKRYYYDFFVNNQYFIEYDGVQHFNGWFRDESNLRWQQNQDSIKSKYCTENGIKLIRIPYTMLDNLQLSDLVPTIGENE